MKGVKLFVLCLFFVVVFSCLVCAGSVTRSFDSSNVGINQEVEVSINVDVEGSEGDSFYIMYDVLPSGWIVVDKGVGHNELPHVVSWAVIQNPVDVVYTYTAMSPACQEVMSLEVIIQWGALAQLFEQ